MRRSDAGGCGRAHRRLTRRVAETTQCIGLASRRKSAPYRREPLRASADSTSGAKRVIAARFSVVYRERCVGAPLRKLGVSRVSAQSGHSAQDERVVEAFDDTSPPSSARVRWTCRKDADRNLIRDVALARPSGAQTPGACARFSWLRQAHQFDRLAAPIGWATSPDLKA
jgi:hypothetical protein